MTLGRLTPAEIQARTRDKMQAALVAARDKLVSPAVVKRRIEARFGPGSAPEQLPRHIRPYANFMRESSMKEPTKRDLIKAYAIARSSIGRVARTIPAICKRFPDYEPLKRAARREDARPEDIFATLLFSPMGKRYLDAAERGHFDSEAAREITNRMHCFGLDNTLHADMRYAVTMGGRLEQVKQKLRAPAPEWIEFVKRDVHNVSAAKAGFLAALLGRGDVPTFDARELDLWRHTKIPYVDKKGRPQMKHEDVNTADVLAYREEVRRWPMELTPAQEPFREHLIHHAIWDSYPDATKQSKTTHGSVIRAMQFAGAPSAKKCPAFTLAQAKRAASKLRGAHVFPASSIRVGMNVEREHADVGSCHSPTLAARIALAHLRERPDYYVRLQRYVERR